jgi:hypothetical protein
MQPEQREIWRSPAMVSLAVLFAFHVTVFCRASRSLAEHESD